MAIEQFLIKQTITHEPQKKFLNLRNIKQLTYDFHLPDYNLLVEFDGMQHYKPIKFYGGIKSLYSRRTNDQLKNNYCRENNIYIMMISTI